MTEYANRGEAANRRGLAARPGHGRQAVIANARSRRANEATRGLAVLCDERAYIDGELRAAGLARLSNEEAGRLCLVG